MNKKNGVWNTAILTKFPMVKASNTQSYGVTACVMTFYSNLHTCDTIIDNSTHATDKVETPSGKIEEVRVHWPMVMGYSKVFQT